MHSAFEYLHRELVNRRCILVMQNRVSLNFGVVHGHVLAKTSHLRDTKPSEPPHEPRPTMAPPGSPTWP